MPVAILTGASKGLGLALARSLTERGWNLVIDARDAGALDAVAAELGANVVAVPGDVTDPDHRAALIAAAEHQGRLDLVVNNASTLGSAPMPHLADLRPDDLARVMATNVIAPLALVQEALPRLAHGAAVINVTSDAAVEGYAGWGAYGASKAALEQMSNVLAAEHPELRVWWVDPGDMRTQMHQDAFPGEDISDRPLPEEIAPTFMWLIEQRPESGRVRAADLLAVPA